MEAFALIGIALPAPKLSPPLGVVSQLVRFGAGGDIEK
jgi:hypothetical protein